MSDSDESSFHVLVLSGLRASDDHALDDAWGAPVRFDRAGFDEAMATVAPTLAIDVPDPLPSGRGKKKRTELTFGAMKSFRPDVMMEQAAILRGLRAGASNVPPPMVPAKGAGASLLDDILTGMGSAPADQLARPLDDTLAAIVIHPEVRALERSWRGLHFVASRAPRNVVVEAIDASVDRVEEVLARLARLPDAAPFDLVVVDHMVGSSRRDLDRLDRWAELAEAIGAPLVAGALPELLGHDDLGALGRSQRRLRSSDDPRATAFRSVAGHDPLRWVTLAMNGALARPRHAGPVKRTFGVVLEEPEELYLGPAVMVAALAVESFARTGWACSLTGPKNGRLEGLPVHTVDDRGAAVAIGLEALADEGATTEAAAAGVALFASVPNGDAAVLAHAPVVFRAPSTAGGAAAAATLGLADQLFIARVARAIVQLAAAIPDGTPEQASRDVVRLALGEMFGEGSRKPDVDVTIAGAPAFLEVTVRPRGFHGVRLEEATLGAPLG